MSLNAVVEASAPLSVWINEHRKSGDLDPETARAELSLVAKASGWALETLQRRAAAVQRAEQQRLLEANGEALRAQEIAQVVKAIMERIPPTPVVVNVAPPEVTVHMPVLPVEVTMIMPPRHETIKLNRNRDGQVVSMDKQEQ